MGSPPLRRVVVVLADRASLSTVRDAGAVRAAVRAAGGRPDDSVMVQVVGEKGYPLVPLMQDYRLALIRWPYARDPGDTGTADLVRVAVDVRLAEFVLTMDGLAAAFTLVSLTPGIGGRLAAHLPDLAVTVAAPGRLRRFLSRCRGAGGIRGAGGGEAAVLWSRRGGHHGDVDSGVGVIDTIDVANLLSAACVVLLS